jgi:hypothetical protein
MRLLPIVALLGAAGLVAAAAAPVSAGTAADVRAVDRDVAGLEQKVELMEISAERYADWETCIKSVPVTEYGDPDRQSGFVYDERDGTGLEHRSALAVDRTSRPGNEDYMFLDFSRKGDCQSAAPLAGGTADAAKARGAAAAESSVATTVRRLEKRVRRLRRSSRRLQASSARFDEWESCVSWVPVTEYGDPDLKYGFLYGGRDASALGFRPAITIDRSEWDDPDYMFLAFVGGDRPGGECKDEPGEAVDRALPPPARRLETRLTRTQPAGSLGSRVDHLQGDVESLTEDVDDLQDPVAEFDQYDECMYMIGVRSHGNRDGSAGYVWGNRRRPALSMDIRGPGAAQYRFMGFPAEEPPSIECNEDAGQATTASRSAPEVRTAGPAPR